MQKIFLLVVYILSVNLGICTIVSDTLARGPLSKFNLDYSSVIRSDSPKCRTTTKVNTISREIRVPCKARLKTSVPDSECSNGHGVLDITDVIRQPSVIRGLNIQRNRYLKIIQKALGTYLFFKPFIFSFHLDYALITNDQLQISITGTDVLESALLVLIFSKLSLDIVVELQRAIRIRDHKLMLVRKKCEKREQWALVNGEDKVEIEVDSVSIGRSYGNIDTEIQEEDLRGYNLKSLTLFLAVTQVIIYGFSKDNVNPHSYMELWNVSYRNMEYSFEKEESVDGLGSAESDFID